MKKILFLDIDGVLNHRVWFENPIRKQFVKKKSQQGYDRTNMICKWNLFWLSLFCKIKNLKIVLTSSWRCDWDIDGKPKNPSIIIVDSLFKKFGLKIIGRTIFGKVDHLEGTYEIPTMVKESSFFGYYRGCQILDYIEKHNLNIKECLIVDDDTSDIRCFKNLTPILIKTNFYGILGGFQPHHFFRYLFK